MSAKQSLALMYGAIFGILVFGVGFVLHIAIFQSDESSTSEPVALIDSDKPAYSNTQSKSEGFAPQLDEVLTIRSPYGRDIAMRSLVADGTNEQLKQLLRMSNEVGSLILRDEIQLVLIQRYASIDPVESFLLIADFDENSKSRLTSAIWEEWSSADLSNAIDFASSLDIAGRKAALEGIARSTLSLSNESFQKIAKQLGHEQVALDHIALTKIDAPIDNPESEWNSFLSEHGNNLTSFSNVQREFLSHVLYSWILVDGVDVAKGAIASLNDHVSRTATIDQLLPRLAANHPQHARLFVANMLDFDRGMLIQSVGNWVETEPLAAIELMSSLEDKDVRHRMQQAAIESWALSNPMNLLSSIENVPSHFQTWSRSTALRILAQSYPDLAAEEIVKLPDSPEKDSVLSTIAHSWFKSDPSAVIDWASTDPDLSEIVESLVYTQIMDLANSDPQSALNLALQHTVDELGVGYEALIIKEVANYDIEKAIDLLDFARNVATQTRAYSAVGQVLIQEGETERALALVGDDSPEVQYQYYRWISVFWIQENAQEVYERMGDLPSEEIQHFYADSLLRQNTRSLFLSSEQAEHLETYLISVTEESN